MQLTTSTPRLKLTPLAPTDADFIKELVNTPGWLAFIGDRNVHSHEDALAYIKRITDNPNVVYWVVRQKDTTVAMGIITFIKREYLGDRDIGFAFLPQYAKQGFAYEAAMVVLAAVMNENEVVLATTVPENISSIKLLEKMGLRFHREIVDDGDKLLVYCISADKFKIDLLTKRFFEVFCNKRKEPDWTTINKICIADALIVKKSGIVEAIYGVDSFIEPRKKILTDGTLTDFEEKEIKEETKLIGNIAQRYSRYKKTGKLEGKLFEEYGNKFFQFIKTGGDWKISALVWEDE